MGDKLIPRESLHSPAENLPLESVTLLRKSFGATND